ncbi:MAG: branched-chain-amino-acid transaminase [Pseudomonadota bacterium]
MNNYIYLNGEFIQHDEAKISVFDRGFLYGDGLFETMRAYSGRVFMLDEHLSRLFDSLDKLNIYLNIDKEILKSTIDKLLTINHLSDAYIRITVSRGKHSDTLTFNDNYTPTLVIMAKKLSPYPQEYYIKGTVVIISDIRQNSFSPLSQHKSISYFNNILAKEEARKKGAFEAILLNSEGELAEGSTSNIFIAKSGKILTPTISSHILPGVTREVVLNILHQLKFQVEEKKICPEELLSSDEIFLTNSIMEVMPVVEVDGKKIGNGKPGQVFKRILEAYRELAGQL